MAILSFSDAQRSDVRSYYRAVVGMSTHTLSTDEYREVHHLLAQVWTTGTAISDPDEITLVGDVCYGQLFIMEHPGEERHRALLLMRRMYERQYGPSRGSLHEIIDA